VLQFGRFAIVGGTGVLVNLVVLVVVKHLGPHPEDALLGLSPTAFHVRWYHVYSTVAFVVANLWNFQLNRRYTFHSAAHQKWWKEYWPFLAVGLLGGFTTFSAFTLETFGMIERGQYVLALGVIAIGAAGALAGLAGVFYAARYGTVSSGAGYGMELQAVGAAVIGGVAIFGGSGTVWGAALGAFLLVTINRALPILGISDFWQQAVVGALIIAAITLDRVLSAREARRLVAARDEARAS